MFVRGLLRLCSNNLCPNRMSFSLINSLGYQSRFYLRNIHASANIISESGNHGNFDKSGAYSFRMYIENNNNFKSSLSEIMSLNFPVDDKHESLKLMVKLKENLQNDCLRRELLDCLNKEISTFDIEDIMKVIALASDIGINRACRNFFSDFVTSIDNELKIRTFKLDEILEILYVLKHTLFMGKSLKHFRFYFKLYRSFEKLHKYQPIQVTHIFYYLEELNQSSKSVYKYPILKYVKTNLSQFKIDEMGIILAALNRAKLFTSDHQFIQDITDKLINEIESVNSIHLFYICRFLQQCSSVHSFKIIIDFQEKLIPHISKFTANSLIMALLSGYPFSLNLSFWNEVIEKVKTELNTLSIADIVRTTSITTAFKVKGEEFLKLAIDKVEKQNLEQCFPHFVIFCKHLVTHQIYPKKLLDIVLSEDFVDKMITRLFSREVVAWVFLNYSLQIDKPEYQFVGLNKASEKKIIKKLYALTCKDAFVSPFKIRISLCKHLKAIFGESQVAEVNCLPHLTRGVVMRFDENLNVAEIRKEHRFTSQKLVKVPLDQHFWICINPTIILPEGLSPIQETYVRHLTALGYKPVLVQVHEFHHYNCLGTEELKNYLKDVIQKVLDEISLEKQKQK